MDTGWKKILQRLYDNGLIDEARLNSCIVLGLISEEEKLEIVFVAEEIPEYAE